MVTINHGQHLTQVLVLFGKVENPTVGEVVEVLDHDPLHQVRITHHKDR